MTEHDDNKLKIRVTIDGKLEILRGIEAEVYLKQGEKAVINRRIYLKDNNDYIISLMKQQAVGKFSPRNMKNTVTYKILEGDYDE